MARQARQESSTGYYHLMMRGINGEGIFGQDRDKVHFLELFSEQQEAGFLSLAAWCIMDTHIHAIVQAKKAALAAAAKVVSIKYARHYNRTQARLGPVFCGRFRSERIEDENYLLGTVRYVHMNPVKAGLVWSPHEFQRSSFLDYMGSAKHLHPAEKSFVLGFFGGDLSKFTSFHDRADDNEYLETREDAGRERQERAVKTIEQFCREQGIEKVADFHRHPALFEKICRVLVNGLGLSLRKAAEHLETTHSRVYQALSERD